MSPTSTCWAPKPSAAFAKSSHAESSCTSADGARLIDGHRVTIDPKTIYGSTVKIEVICDTKHGHVRRRKTYAPTKTIFSLWVLVAAHVSFASLQQVIQHCDMRQSRRCHKGYLRGPSDGRSQREQRNYDVSTKDLRTTIRMATVRSGSIKPTCFTYGQHNMSLQSQHDGIRKAPRSWFWIAEASYLEHGWHWKPTYLAIELQDSGVCRSPSAKCLVMDKWHTFRWEAVFPSMNW